MNHKNQMMIYQWKHFVSLTQLCLTINIQHSKMNNKIEILVYAAHADLCLPLIIQHLKAYKIEILVYAAHADGLNTALFKVNRWSFVKGSEYLMLVNVYIFCIVCVATAYSKTTLSEISVLTIHNYLSFTNTDTQCEIKNVK